MDGEPLELFDGLAIECHGFFQKQMLAGFQSALCKVKARCGWCSDDDGLDGRILKEGIPVAGAPQAMGVAGFVQPTLAWMPEGDRFEIGVGGQRGEMNRFTEAKACNGNANGGERHGGRIQLGKDSRQTALMTESSRSSSPAGCHSARKRGIPLTCRSR